MFKHYTVNQLNGRIHRLVNIRCTVCPNEVPPTFCDMRKKTLREFDL